MTRFDGAGEFVSNRRHYTNLTVTLVSVFVVVLTCVWAIFSPATLLIGLGLLGSTIGLVVYRTKLVLVVFVLGLLTLARTFSTYSAGPVPVSLFLLALLAGLFRKEIQIYLRDSRGGRWVLFVWALWSAWATVRLSLDFGTYGQLAARDALIAYSFFAFFVGVAVAIRFSKEQIIRVIRWVSLVAAAYSWVYVFRSALPSSISASLDFSNVGVAGLAIFALGLSGRGVTYRLICLVSGFAAIVVSQGRTIYFAVPIVLFFYVVQGSRGLSLGQWALRCVARIGFLVLAACGALMLLHLLGSITNVQGRLGGITLNDIVSQLTSVFDSSTALSGSLSDRDRWWTEIIGRLSASFSNAMGGLGLGSDLLSGFQAPDGSLVRKPHNDYLETAARFGVPSAICLVILVLLGARPAIRVFRLGSELVGLSAWWLAAAMTAFAQPYLAYPHGAMMLALVIGILVQITANMKPDRSQAVAFRPQLRSADVWPPRVAPLKG